MRDNRKISRLVLAIVGVLLLSVAAYQGFAPSTQPEVKNRNLTIQINSIGLHQTPESEWIESIDVTEKGENFALHIQEKRVTWGKPWWNPFAKGNFVEIGVTMHVPKFEGWIILVSDETRTVAYETDSKRYLFEHTDLAKGSIIREEVKSPK